jgi:hypothetical protein
MYANAHHIALALTPYWPCTDAHTHTYTNWMHIKQNSWVLHCITPLSNLYPFATHVLLILELHHNSKGPHVLQREISLWRTVSGLCERVLCVSVCVLCVWERVLCVSVCVCFVCKYVWVLCVSVWVYVLVCACLGVCVCVCVCVLVCVLVWVSVCVCWCVCVCVGVIVYVCACIEMCVIWPSPFFNLYPIMYWTTLWTQNCSLYKLYGSDTSQPTLA